ncbi:MAG TPA: carboxypeptidase regulatory-like domain-containing protein, partial [Bryobacteraceae bacterium]
GVLVFNKPEPQRRNFAPRIGIAYSPGTSGKTSIRAGFGMAYDVLYDNIGILSLPPQLSSTVDTDPLGSANGSGPNFLKNGGILPNASVGSLSRADAIASTSNFVPDQKLPYSIQYNLGVQHVFANNYTFEIRYLGTRGVHLNVQQRVNVLSKVDSTHFLPTYLSAPSQATLDSLPTTLTALQARPRIASQFLAAGFTNNIVEFSPIGNSTYNGLALQLDRRFTNGLQFKTAYTWSHLIDDSTADFFTTRLTPRRTEDFQNLKRDKASSALDRRHRFTFVAVYDVPFMSHSSNWLAKNILGNWEFAPIYTFESPEYATVQSSTDSNLNGDSAGDRTILNPGGVDGTSSNVTALKNTAGATVAYLATNPNARYIKAAAGALTNSGRNTLPTRRINNVDLSIIKRFSYHERFKLELVGQFLNAFNHPQFTPGSINQITSIGTTGSGVLNYVTAGNKDFNNPEAAFASNARVIQVAAKIVF